MRVLLGVVFLFTLQFLSAVGASSGPPALSPTNIVFRLLDLESTVTPVDEARRAAATAVLDAAVAAGDARMGESRGSVGSFRPHRRAVRALLQAVDDVLVGRDFVYPASGAVDLLADCFVPCKLTDQERKACEGQPQNERRRARIAERFPGPFYPLDCDTGCALYLGVAEALGWPLRVVWIPSRNRQVAHTFIRWRDERVTLDWETTEGRERASRGTGPEGRAARERGIGTDPEIELTVAQVFACERYLMAVHWERQGDDDAALRELRATLTAFPEHLDARRQFAWITATAPTLVERDVPAAVTHAEYVVERAADPDARDTLAAAYAAAGRFPLAVAAENAAIASAEATASQRLGYRQRLALYEAGRVYRRSAMPRGP